MKKSFLTLSGLRSFLNGLLKRGVKYIWQGTQEEWDALDDDEKAKYDIAQVTGGEGGSVVISDQVAKGDMNPVTSNAVATAIEGIDTGGGSEVNVIAPLVVDYAPINQQSATSYINANLKGNSFIPEQVKIHDCSVIIGSKARATGLAIGYRALQEQYASRSEQELFDLMCSVCIGFRSCLGTETLPEYDNTTTDTNTGALSSVAIGGLSNAICCQSVAIGVSAVTRNIRGVAIGYSALATHTNSIAIGYNSNTKRANEASFGNSNTESQRFLANVKDPELDSDAATKHYVDNAVNKAWKLKDQKEISSTNNTLSDTYTAIQDFLSSLEFNATDKVFITIKTITQNSIDNTSSLYIPFMNIPEDYCLSFTVQIDKAFNKYHQAYFIIHIGYEEENEKYGIQLINGHYSTSFDDRTVFTGEQSSGVEMLLTVYVCE